MSVSGGIITAPIYAEDSYNLLGVPKQPSGYDMGYIGSNAHGRINMWSKCKPFRHHKYFSINNEDRKAANFGINVPSFDFDKYTEKEMFYEPANVTYRIEDWINYNHNSIPFVDFYFPSKIYWNESASMTIYLNWSVGNGFDEDTMCLFQDAYPYSVIRDDDYYITLLLNSKNSTTRKTYITDDTSIRQRLKDNNLSEINITLPKTFTSYFSVGETLTCIFCIQKEYKPLGEFNPIPFAAGYIVSPYKGKDRADVGIIRRPLPDPFEIEIYGTVRSVGYLLWKIKTLTIKIKANVYRPDEWIVITGEYFGALDAGRFELLRYDLSSMYAGEERTINFEESHLNNVVFEAKYDEPTQIEIMVLNDKQDKTLGSGFIDVP